GRQRCRSQDGQTRIDRSECAGNEHYRRGTGLTLTFDPRFTSPQREQGNEFPLLAPRAGYSVFSARPHFAVWRSPVRELESRRGLCIVGGLAWASVETLSRQRCKAAGEYAWRRQQKRG